MISDRLRVAVDRAAQLPVEAQNALAMALESALARAEAVEAVGVNRPGLAPLAAEMSEAFERALRENAATLAYLKDR